MAVPHKDANLLVPNRKGTGLCGKTKNRPGPYIRPPPPAMAFPYVPAMLTRSKFKINNIEAAAINT